MNLHEFVFSYQRKYRLQRHFAFWLSWLLYLILNSYLTDSPTKSFFYDSLPGLKDLGFISYSMLLLLKCSLLVFTHLFFTYTILYIFIPHYLLKRKYLQLVPGLMVLCILIISIGYFLYSLVFPAIDTIFNLQKPGTNTNIVWSGINSGLIGAIKIMLIATAITLLKRWWLKQKEKEMLEKEKIHTELQLLKAQIHPAFLFSTLDNIISHAKLDSSIAPEMLIKLSDLLSYMLYDCDEPKVKLEKEIGMIREYMSLEKIRMGERLEMTLQIKGDCNGQLISPLLLLPFIDNSFQYCNNELVEQAWVNLEITIDAQSLSMKLINGMPPKINDDTRVEGQSLVNVQKRLGLLYPGRHDLKINEAQELLLVHLNLKLEEPTLEAPPSFDIKPALNHAGI